MVFNMAHIRFQCKVPVGTLGRGLMGFEGPGGGNCVSAESGKNQLLLTGCSCDWQSAAATRSVGRARSAGREITGRKTCPTKREEQTRARLCTPNVSSYWKWPVQAGFNKEKANKLVITVAEACAREWVVFSRRWKHTVVSSGGMKD